MSRDASFVATLCRSLTSKVEDIHHHVGRERRRLARRPLLLRSFFRHSTLPFHV